MIVTLIVTLRGEQNVWRPACRASPVVNHAMREPKAEWDDDGSSVQLGGHRLFIVAVDVAVPNDELGLEGQEDHAINQNR